MNPLTAPRFPHLRAITASLTLTALLAGCAGLAPSTGSIDPATGLPRPAPGAPAVSALITEQRWLEEWFRGTPVVIARADSSTLAVDVPLAHSFDTGSNRVKPALGAVLDRVATSLHRQPAMRVSIAAPADTNGAARLADGRAQKVRERLVSRGVAATRVTIGDTVAAGGAVQMRIVMAPLAISQLGDAWLPVPTLGTTAVAAPGAYQAAASSAPNSES